MHRSFQRVHQQISHLRPAALTASSSLHTSPTASSMQSSLLGGNYGTENKGGLSQTETKKKLAELIQSVSMAMLTTVTSDGKIRSRPMVTKQIDETGDIWFLTGHDSGKVKEIEAKPEQVNITYASDKQNVWISVSGHAEESRDKEKIKQLWNEAYKAWFPKGLEDPNIAAVRVTIDEAEYWDSSSSMVVHAIGFLKAKLTGEQYNPQSAGTQDHGKIES